MSDAVASPLDLLSESEYKKRIRAWTLYDWANSAFATTILAAVLPVYYSSVAGGTLPSAAKATQYWSLTLSISVFIVALLSPILGTVSDIMRGKKKFLALFVGIGVVGTGLLVLADTGDWLLASIFFIIGRIGFGAANVFYDSLLPHIAKDEDQDSVSTKGYALGYLGGGILLAINIVMIFTMEGTAGARFSFLTVAVWWALFSIPLLLQVPEPESVGAKLKEGESLIGKSFSQLIDTVKGIREYNELFKYLVAFLIYNDGIGIIISVAAIYGAELGFGSIELTLAILLVQFVGIPYSLVFGNLPSKGNAKQAMYVAFVIFNILMLPTVGILGARVLPQSISGTPSPDFETIGANVGQGIYGADSGAFNLDGGWNVEVVSAETSGAETDLSFATSTQAGDTFELPFNGQKVDMVYATGPAYGSFNVLIDGAPLLDGDGNPSVIDASNDTDRYDVEVEFSAETEGQHTLSLVNNGNTMAISQLEVKPPARTSNLGVIIGMLAALAAVGALFARLLGPRLFQGIANSLDTKRSIMLALSAYAIIAVWGFFLDSVVEFWFLAWMVAVVQGGSQALSRSLYAAMTPTAKSGEFFGFFSIMSKFASFLSPLVFVASVAIFNSSRPGVLALIVFFAVGMYLLNQVDVEEGKRVAKAVDAELAAAAAT